jgi:hypothetical protein
MQTHSREARELRWRRPVGPGITARMAKIERGARDRADLDAELLEAALEREDLSFDVRERFESMAAELARRGPLSEKQRAWVTAATQGGRYEAPVEYENLVSSGRVPRGREVASMVRGRALKPPGRG